MGVGRFGRSWTKVAELVGDGVLGSMCYERWGSQMDPEKLSSKRAKSIWTPEMVRKRVRK
jgi:hypothetical protein